MLCPRHLALPAIVLCVACMLSLASGRLEERRLLQFADGTREWVPLSQLDELALDRRQLRFVDVTKDGSKPIYLPPNSTFSLPAPSRANTVNPILSRIDIDRVFETMTHISSYQHRLYNTSLGVSAAQWVESQLRALTAASGRGSGVTIEIVTHSFPMPSIIATIVGSAGSRAGSVILSCHMDSTSKKARFENGTAPGADDNGSGVAALLEAFRVLTSTASFHPVADVQFMFFAGEEFGSLGSKDVSRRYREQGRTVLGLMNLDMICYQCPNNVIGLVDDLVNADMNRYVATLAGMYCSLPVGVDHCGYNCSDHAPWTWQGYPTAYPFECAKDINPYMHKANDTVDKCSRNHTVEFVRLAVAWLVESSLSASSQPQTASSEVLPVHSSVIDPGRHGSSVSPVHSSAAEKKSASSRLAAPGCALLWPGALALLGLSMGSL